jgi:hypothetical protein
MEALLSKMTLGDFITLLEVGLLAYLWYRIESIQVGVDFLTDLVEGEDEDFT